jgi:hypothetical protein
MRTGSLGGGRRLLCQILRSLVDRYLRTEFTAAISKVATKVLVENHDIIRATAIVTSSTISTRQYHGQSQTKQVTLGK